MPINQSFAGTMHVRKIANMALHEGSVTVEFPTEAECIRFRMQFNNLRAQDRAFSKKRIKNFEDPKWGTSDFDVIETKIVEGKGNWSITLRTVHDALAKMVIKDAKGNIIKPEDI